MGELTGAVACVVVVDPSGGEGTVGGGATEAGTVDGVTVVEVVVPPPWWT